MIDSIFARAGLTGLPSSRWRGCAAASGALLLATAAQAQGITNLQNLDFENTVDFEGWTRQAYVVDGTGKDATQGGIPGLRSDANPRRSPTSLADLNLTVANGGGSSAILRKSVVDGYSDVELPAWGGATARIHSGDDKNAAGGGNGKDNKSSGISQSFKVTAGDIGKHIKFAAAPVLGQPSNAHPDNRQSYFFIAVTNVTKGTTLYSAFNFAGETGVNWKTAGIWMYTDWQLVDVALDAAQVDVGDEIKIEVIASGCADGGHAGYVYLDVPKGLEVVAHADKTVYPLHSNPDGSTEVIYTYTYTNQGDSAVENVSVAPTIPALSAAGSRSGQTQFVSVDAKGGTCSNVPTVGATETTMACNFGQLNPGESRTFTMTVRVPAGTSADKVVNGSYPISGDGAKTIDGPIVRSGLLADMVADLSKLPAGGGKVGQAYPDGAAFSCTNRGSTAATGATCAITGLPDGVTTGQCLISPPTPATDWAQSSAVPAGATVTCPVTGTPLSKPGDALEITAGADNDADDTNNQQALPPAQPAQAPTPVPTLGQWGQGLMATLLAALGVVSLRRGRRH